MALRRLRVLATKASEPSASSILNNRVTLLMRQCDDGTRCNRTHLEQTFLRLAALPVPATARMNEHTRVNVAAALPVQLDALQQVVYGRLLVPRREQEPR